MGQLLELTSERLRELLSYNEDTGIFTWRVSRGKGKAGSPAGGLDKDGYVVVGIDGREYRAHRLAWFWKHGEFPPLLDHRDMVRESAVLSNLRPATKSQNGSNRGKPKSNVSGVKGVSWHKETGKWRAQIMVDYKCVHLGLFGSIEDARLAREKAAESLHGEFVHHG